MIRSLIIIFVFLFPFSAFADGGFVWRNEKIDIHEPEQKALLIFEDGIEELVLEVKFEGAPEEFGWIVPLPSRPEMKNPTPELFEVLSRVTQNPYFGRSEISRRMSSTFGMVENEISVVHQRVGIYDVALLEGNDRSGLIDWLDDYGFRLRGNAKEILAEYQDAGWIFAAMKIAPEEINSEITDKLANGTIQPIYFRFETDRPVFPLKISAITGHSSEVLLYTLSATGLVPKASSSVLWDTTCRVNTFWYHDGDDWFLEELQDRFSHRKNMVLTKNRAVFTPEQMQDVFFDPYFSDKLLWSKSLRTRVEAITYLGHCSPPGAMVLLVDFLKNRELPIDTKGDINPARSSKGAIPPGQDVLSALWALGEIYSNGGCSPDDVSLAVAMTKSWIHKSNIWARLEALSSLMLMSEKEAVPLCLSIILEDPAPSDYFVKRPLNAVCVRHLFAFGNQDCVADLQTIIDKHYDPGSWDRIWLYHQRNGDKLKAGRTALQLAAACGDSVARAELTDILMQASAFATWRWKIQHPKPGPGGYLNCFPRTLVPAIGILYDDLENGLIVDEISKNMKVRPEFKDALFREVAYASWEQQKMSGDYCAVLLSHLGELNGKDVATLLEIWSQALQTPERVMIPLQSYINHRTIVNVSMNPDALAASYALGVQGQVEVLVSLWEGTPWEYLPEKGALAVALALTERNEAVAPVMEYVKKVWGDVASSEDLLVSLSNAEPRRYGWPTGIRLDFPHREQSLTQFLKKHCRSEVKELAGDLNQPPVLRLYMLKKIAGAWHGVYDQRSVALKKLQAETSDPNISVIIDRMVKP